MRFWLFLLLACAGFGARAALDPAGFTVLEPAADSRLIYLSSSSGKDSRPCTLAKPCKTLAAGLAQMREGFPDHLYLKAGDEFEGTLSKVTSGRSPAEPSVVTAYGSGARPVIKSKSHALTIRNKKRTKAHVAIVGLHFFETGNIYMLFGNRHFLFEDNKFSNVEVIIHGDTSDPKSMWPSDITIRRNISTGHWSAQTSYNQKDRPSNYYIDHVTRLLIEENVVHQGGWHPTVPGAGANQFNHGLYLNYNNDGNSVVLRNNIITWPSSLGAHVRAGGLVENNFVEGAAVGLQLGYKTRPLASGVVAKGIDNVITLGHSAVKGVDPCVDKALCTAALWCFNAENEGPGKILLEGNVCSNLSPLDVKWREHFKSLNIVAFRAQEAQPVLKGNVVWEWESPVQGHDKKYPDPGRLRADYEKLLGGDFLAWSLNRPAKVWDKRYTAAGINDFIRAGYGMGPEAVKTDASPPRVSNTPADPPAKAAEPGCTPISGTPIDVSIDAPGNDNWLTGRCGRESKTQDAESETRDAEKKQR